MVLPDLLDGTRMTRREFLGLMGGAIVVLLTGTRSQASAQATSGRKVPLPVSRDLPREITGWLYIDEQGKVTVYAGKVELGQNARTLLSLVVAGGSCACSRRRCTWCWATPT